MLLVRIATALFNEVKNDLEVLMPIVGSLTILLIAMLALS